MKKKSLILFVLLAVILTMTACGGKEPANRLEAIQDAGKMVVGTSADYPPFEYVDENGNFVGFDIDVINEIGKRMGVDVEIVDMPFDSLVTAVQENKIDITIAAFNYSEERDEQVDFSDPYWINEDGALVAEDFAGEINTTEDLAKFTLAVQTGTTQDDWVTENLVDAGLMSEDNLFRYDRMDQAALDVKNGRVEVMFADNIPLLALASQIGGLKVVFTSDVSSGPVYLLFGDGETELAAEVNKVIGEMDTEGLFLDYANAHFTD